MADPGNGGPREWRAGTHGIQGTVGDKYSRLYDDEHLPLLKQRLLSSTKGHCCHSVGGKSLSQCLQPQLRANRSYTIIHSSGSAHCVPLTVGSLRAVEHKGQRSQLAALLYNKLVLYTALDDNQAGARASFVCRLPARGHIVEYVDV